jgi:pimeloyl-ACP methyl ester carboxylesterase
MQEPRTRRPVAMQGVAPARAFTRSSPRLAYFLSGPPEGDCVVLLHGVGSSAETWKELRGHLGGGFRYLAADYRGHGASEWGEPPYKIADFVADHLRLLDELRIKTAHLVGFSIGAIFAQAIALADPRRTLSLVLLNSICGRTEEERRRALARLELIRTTPPAEVARASIPRWFTKKFIEGRRDLVDAERAIVAAIAPEPYAATYEVLATSEVLSDAHRISVPTLIVTGESDEGSTPEMSRKLHREIAGSRLMIRPDLKHYMHIEDSDNLGALIIDFLRHVA